jgi:hypothetical protein
MDLKASSCLLSMLARCRLALIYSAGLSFLVTSFAQAAGLLVAVDDSYDIPPSQFLQVEPFGVLENDTLDGENAGESGATATLLTDVSKGSLTCPGADPDPGLCSDGSFEYTPGAGFDGTDSFVYRAVFGGETSGPATVTLSACDAGPLLFSCWHETAFLAKLSELGYSTFQESFEAAAWDIARSPVSTGSVSSQGIVWTSNHTATNNITTGTGPARTGIYGVFDPNHGIATGTPTQCDIDNPPEHCLYHDGFSGSTLPGMTALHGVGGYISGTNGANPAIVLNGTTEVRFSPVFNFQFIGVIDASASGFTHFEFREVDGKIGQALFIFGDDFTFTGTPILADGDLAPWNNPDGLINAADVLIATQLVLGLRSPGTLQYAHGDMNTDSVIDVADLILITQTAL